MSAKSVDLLESAALALQFFLELFALVSLGYWGFQIGHGMIAKIGLGLGAPLLFALVWGMFMAPRASMRLPDPERLVIELLLFGIAIVALYFVDYSLVAIVLGVLVIINETLLYVWNLR